MRTCSLYYKKNTHIHMDLYKKQYNAKNLYVGKMMRLIYLTSSIVVMIILLLINVVTWRFAGNAPINVNDGVDHSDDFSSSMMILTSKHNKQPQISSSVKVKPTRRRLSSSNKEKSLHRSLQLSTDSFMDGKLSVVAFAALPNENVHMLSIEHKNENDVHHTTLSTRPYRPNKYSTILTKNNHNLRYVDDTLCTGCRYVYTSNEVNEDSKTCWNEIERLLEIDDNNFSMVEAAFEISKLYPDNCHRCNPNSCTDDEKKYYRPDDIISSQDIGYTRTHFLKSIDSNDRVPLNILTSVDELWAFLQNPYNVWPHREYFMEFNPSITHLPNSQIPQQLLLLRGEDNNDDDSYYLASYRVSTAHLCFKDQDTNQIRNVKYAKFRPNDFLGIAILDINLNIILETIVDIRSVVRSNIPELISDQLYEDGRLFTLNNQLYLGSFTMLYPIWLVPPIDNNNYSNNKDESNDIVQLPPYMTSEQKLNKNYSDTEIIKNLLNVYIQRSGYCSNDMVHQRHGKNLNYFYDHNQQRIVREIYPMGAKEYLETDCQPSDKNVDFVMPNKPIPLDSYSTTDELVLSHRHVKINPVHSDRGNYCCLSVNEPQYYFPKYTDQTTLLLGISHKLVNYKVSRPLQFDYATYFHNFYAMEPVAPYNIVARSGLFCLGYPQYEQDGINSTISPNQFNNPRRLNLFRFGHEQYDCSRIHFITGMVEALHDPNQVIISYGVDDCYSRFIMISKEHILSLLFNNK